MKAWGWGEYFLGKQQKPAFAGKRRRGEGAVSCRLIRSDSWGHGTVQCSENEEEMEVVGEWKRKINRERKIARWAIERME